MPDIPFWVSAVVIFASGLFVFGLKAYVELKELSERRKGRF